MLCGECRAELAQRLEEQARAETPIEHYAREGRMPPQPCKYDHNAKSRTKNQRLCGLACDAGEDYCPRHKAVVAAENAKAAAKELAKHEAQAKAQRPG